MKNINGIKAFGFWKGQPYDIVTDKYEDFIAYRNSISKELVIKHIAGLEEWLSSVLSEDIFTGERFNSGFYVDGKFQFPVDFLRYYKEKNIGIPYEYEDYLKSILS